MSKLRYVSGNHGKSTDLTPEKLEARASIEPIGDLNELCESGITGGATRRQLDPYAVSAGTESSREALPCYNDAPMKPPLFPIIAVLLLVACSAPADDESVTQATAAGPSEIQVSVASDDFAVGTPRVPFVLNDGPDQVADAESVEVTAFDLSSDTPEAVWSGEATNYSDFEVPYWTINPAIGRAGAWGLLADITLRDGRQVQAQFAIQVEAQSSSPAIGDQAPRSQNSTLSTEPDISKLTSGSDPVPGLYEMTVAEAVASGLPTVVSLATPAFCQTRICGPVIGSVESVYDDFGDRANFIHLEIYKEFDTLTLADEVEEWGLTSEPWTFVLDGDGIVAARLGGPVSPRELTGALLPLLQ